MMKKPWNGFISIKIETISSMMRVIVFILSLSLLFNAELFAKERIQEIGIVLVAIGDIDRNVMGELKNDIKIPLLTSITHPIKF
jgi:hypothetical protein